MKKTEISASRIQKNSVTPYCLSFGARRALLLRAVTGLASVNCGVCTGLVARAVHTLADVWR